MLKSHISFSKMCLVKKKVGYFLYKKKFYKISFRVYLGKENYKREYSSVVFYKIKTKTTPLPPPKYPL